jgi:hypothetical protein
MSKKTHPGKTFRVVCFHRKAGCYAWIGRRADAETARFSARQAFLAVYGFLPTGTGPARPYPL